MAAENPHITSINGAVKQAEHRSNHRTITLAALIIIWKSVMRSLQACQLLKGAFRVHADWSCTPSTGPLWDFIGGLHLKGYPHLSVLAEHAGKSHPFKELFQTYPSMIGEDPHN